MNPGEPTTYIDTLMTRFGENIYTNFGRRYTATYKYCKCIDIYTRPVLYIYIC